MHREDLETEKALYLSIRGWIDLVLNKKLLANIPIIKSHQNAPAPSTNYISINLNGFINKIGSASKTDVDDNGKTKVINDWLHAIEIREISGSGFRLQSLLDSLDLEDVKEYFRENQIAVHEEPAIQSVPRGDGEFWKKEALLEIQIGYATKLEENASWVDSIGYEGKIKKEDESEIIL